MQKSNEILISLLTYNSASVISECLDSIKNQSNQNFKCFVFDNDSKDNTLEIVKNYPEVKIVQIGKNEGYTGGHNFALSYFKKNFPNHRYMCVLNPDTVLSKDLFREYFKLFKKEATLYSCVVRKKEKNNQIKFWTGKNIHIPSFTFLRRFIKKDEYQRGFINSGFVQGSCFIVDYSKYTEKKLFKDYFMYHDEIELSIRVRLNYGKILTTTKGFIEHPTKEQKDLSSKTVYLLELNRLKLQSDLFSDFFILLNLPFYIITRIMIFAIYRPSSQSKDYLRGIKDGLDYFQKNIGKPKANFIQTIKFLFIDNFKLK